MRTLRIDSEEWITGALLIGNVGGGVLGSEVPSNGDNGPGFTFADLALPADADKEICGRITTWPASGTLDPAEDTSFEYSGTSGSFEYQLYVDYVQTGPATAVTLNTNVIPAVGNFSIAAGSAFSVAGSSPATVQLAIAADSAFDMFAASGVSASFSVAMPSAFDLSAYGVPVAIFDLHMPSEFVMAGGAAAQHAADLNVIMGSDFAVSAQSGAVSQLDITMSSAFVVRASLVGLVVIPAQRRPSYNGIPARRWSCKG